VSDTQREGERRTLEKIVALAVETGDISSGILGEQREADIEFNARVFFCRLVGRIELKLGKEAAARMANAMGYTHLYANEPTKEGGAS